jgi:hypothetical protein
VNFFGFNINFLARKSTQIILKAKMAVGEVCVGETTAAEKDYLCL